MIIFIFLALFSMTFAQELEPLPVCTDKQTFEKVQEIVDFNYAVCTAAKRKDWLLPNALFHKSDAPGNSIRRGHYTNENETYHPLKQGLVLALAKGDITLYTPWGPLMLLTYSFTPCSSFGAQTIQPSPQHQKKPVDNNLRVAALVSSLSQRLNIQLRANEQAYQLEYWKDELVCYRMGENGEIIDPQYRQEKLYKLKKDISVDTHPGTIGSDEEYLEKSSLDNFRAHQDTNSIFVSSDELFYDVVAFDNKPMPEVQLHDLQWKRINELFDQAYDEGNDQFLELAPEFEQLSKRIDNLREKSKETYTEYLQQHIQKTTER